MYMPKLGTMRLRNRRVRKILSSLPLSMVGVCLVMASAQTTQAPASQPSASPGASSPASTQQTPPSTGTAPSQTPGSQAPPAANPPAGQAPPASVPADQGQGPSATDNGTFVFKVESREVVLHATVVDDRNRLVTSLVKPDFTVLENGQPQQIRQFKLKTIPSPWASLSITRVPCATNARR
jgi:hypothetical protein